jgi:alpha-ribazole phosphatase/probable phosphoglycerate mutase
MVEILYLIRHGATEGSDEPRYKGRTDVPLSALGKEQARATAAYMSSNGLKPEAVHCSPLSRAHVTAEIIASSLGANAPVPHPEFCERDFGQWEGMSFDEIRAKWPEEFSRWASDPLKFSPLGGESTLDVRDRVMPSLMRLIEGGRGVMALVAHGGVNRVVICELLGIPLEHIFRIEQDNACLNIIRFYDGAPVAKLINGNHWLSGKMS